MEVQSPTLTQYSPVLLFYTPWKHQKTFRFSDVFRGYKKATPGCNGLRSLLWQYWNSENVSNVLEMNIIVMSLQIEILQALHCESVMYLHRAQMLIYAQWFNLHPQNEFTSIYWHLRLIPPHWYCSAIVNLWFHSSVFQLFKDQLIFFSQINRVTWNLVYMYLCTYQSGFYIFWNLENWLCNIRKY